MRPLLQFLGFCFIVFFAVGEFQGWYVGFPPSSPMLLYKMDREVNIRRDVTLENDFSFDLRGRVRDGSVQVEAFYEIPPSFQQGGKGKLPKKVFDEVFSRGEQIDISKLIKSGQGRYTVRIVYHDTTGVFRLEASGEGQL
jgi:hypothetical protein